jgi:hypothetical protein
VFVADRGFIPPLVARKGRPPAPNQHAVERVCPRHGLTVYHRYSRGSGKHRYRCKRCVGEAVTDRHRRLRALLIGEAGGRCAVCGYDRCTYNLHFHHVVPATKSFKLAMGTGKSLATYRTEASKCVLVCANCHGEIECGDVPSPPAGSRFRDLQYPQRDSNPRSPP